MLHGILVWLQEVGRGWGQSLAVACISLLSPHQGHYPHTTGHSAKGKWRPGQWSPWGGGKFPHVPTSGLEYCRRRCSAVIGGLNLKVAVDLEPKLDQALTRTPNYPNGPKGRGGRGSLELASDLSAIVEYVPRREGGGHVTCHCSKKQLIVNDAVKGRSNPPGVPSGVLPGVKDEVLTL